jgi:hypothetical protein
LIAASAASFSSGENCMSVATIGRSGACASSPIVKSLSCADTERARARGREGARAREEERKRGREEERKRGREEERKRGREEERKRGREEERGG